MRKFNYILNDMLIGLGLAIVAILVSHLLASCSSTIDGDYNSSPSISQDGMALRLNVHTTDYQPGTKAQAKGQEGIGANSMQILCFDASGNFISMAKDVQNTASSGTDHTVTATVPNTATTLHFLANANITPGDDWTGKSESDILALLESSYTANEKFVYWGSVKKSTAEEMKTFLNDGTKETINMLRDRAKVTVTNNDTDIKTVTLTVCNALPKGMMTGDGETVNLPADVTPDDYIDGTETDLSSAAYAFEHPNQSGNYLKVVLKATYTDNKVRYHQIILENDSHEAYKILRNHEYKITVSKLSKDAGYDSFVAAQQGAPSNNAFVTIDDIIPEVSDGEHSLSIDNGTYIVLNTGATESQSIAFTYTSTDGTMSASDFKATWVENDGLATSDAPTVSYNSSTGKGTINYTLSDIVSTLKTAKLQLLDTKNGLSRTIHLYSITQFNFNATFKSSDGTANQLGKAEGSQGTLTVTVPDDYPTELLPVEFKIASNDINPLNLGVEVSSTSDVDGGKNWNCWFVYKAHIKQSHEITIKNVRTATAGNTGNFYVKAAYFGNAQNIAFTYK